MKHQDLSEKIGQLRASAAAVYEVCLQQKMKPEKITETIKPLSDMLSSLIKKSVKEDLPGCVYAIVRLNHEIKSFKEDIKYLTQKIIDNTSHIDHIKKELIAEMKQTNKTEIYVDGFSICLIETDGGPDIIVK